MNEERMEILRLISDGKISAEEGAKLIEALETGGKKRKKKSFDLDINFEGIADMVKSVGAKVKSTLSQALNFGEEANPLQEGYSLVDLEDGMFPMAETDELSVRTSKSDLVLKVGEPGVAVVGNHDASVWRKGDKVLVKCKGDDLKLTLPPNIAKLDVKSLGGDIDGTLPPVNSPKIQTTGGDISLNGLVTPFVVETTGGDIHLKNVHALEGSAKAATMGGDVSIKLIEDSSVSVEAETLGGNVSADGLNNVAREKGFGKGRLTAMLGEGAAKLKLSTMGGDIEVRRQV